MMAAHNAPGYPPYNPKCYPPHRCASMTADRSAWLRTRPLCGSRALVSGLVSCASSHLQTNAAASKHRQVYGAHAAAPGHEQPLSSRAARDCDPAPSNPAPRMSCGAHRCSGHAGRSPADGGGLVAEAVRGQHGVEHQLVRDGAEEVRRHAAPAAACRQPACVAAPPRMHMGHQPPDDHAPPVAASTDRTARHAAGRIGRAARGQGRAAVRTFAAAAAAAGMAADSRGRECCGGARPVVRFVALCGGCVRRCSMSCLPHSWLRLRLRQPCAAA